MFGIYTLTPIKENPGTVKLQILPGVPHYFLSKLQAEIYLEQYRARLCGVDVATLYDKEQIALRLSTDFTRILELTATDIFDWEFRLSGYGILRELNSEIMLNTLFYDEEVWTAYTTIHSRNIYFKIY